MMMSKLFLIGLSACVVAGVYLANPKNATSPAVQALKTGNIQQGENTATNMRNGGQETVLKRAPNGHFYADVMVNGTNIRMMVDTGASQIALSRADAERLNIPMSSSDFSGTAMTAAGAVGVKPVTLERVAIGYMETDNVEAAIVEQGLDQSLLGQSWLSRVGQVTIEGDTMTLK